MPFCQPAIRKAWQKRPDARQWAVFHLFSRNFIAFAPSFFTWHEICY
jgi:hypothetical protein